MKHVVIKWEDKLDDLYFLAGETGSDMESCINEWNDCWLPDIKLKHGKNCSFEIEPIPDDELIELNEYCNSEE